MGAVSESLRQRHRYTTARVTTWRGLWRAHTVVHSGPRKCFSLARHDACGPGQDSHRIRPPIGRIGYVRWFPHVQARLGVPGPAAERRDGTGPVPTPITQSSTPRASAALSPSLRARRLRACQHRPSHSAVSDGTKTAVVPPQFEFSRTAGRRFRPRCRRSPVRRRVHGTSHAGMPSYPPMFAACLSAPQTNEKCSHGRPGGKYKWGAPHSARRARGLQCPARRGGRRWQRGSRRRGRRGGRSHGGGC